MGEVPQTNVFQREMKGTERCSSQMFVMSEFTEVDLTSRHPHEAAYSMLVLAGYGVSADLITQRKPTWLVEVSTGSGWRAAGR